MSRSYLNLEEIATRATKNYLTSLHSTRKQPSKPLKRSAVSSSSPLKPMNPQVYRVEPVNFKELVQRLTGAPDHEQESVSKPLSSFNDVANQSSSSLGFDISSSSSSWGDLSLQTPSNFSRW